LPIETYRAVNATAVGVLIEAAARGGVRRVVHCSTVGVHGDVEGPPANEDAALKPGDIYQETKLEGERIAREAGARTGVEVTIARPTGIYGPGDRRLLKLFRGVARRRWITLGNGEIYYHLTYIDDLVDGFRLCGEHPAAANRTVLAGGEVTTLNALVARVAEVARVPAPRLHLPVWPVWIAGAACEALCTPFIEPPLIVAASTFSRRAAHSIARGRATSPATRHGRICATASRARCIGTANMAGSDVHDDPSTTGAVAREPAPKPVIARAQDQLFAPGQSSRDKYQALVVGRPGLAALAKYELVVMLSQGFAGAIGLALRKIMYPWLLGSCGHGVVFGQHVVVRHPHKIHIGNNVVIDDHCLIDAKGETNLGIRIGDGVFIGRNTIPRARTATSPCPTAPTSGSTAKCSRRAA
jgi:hypothetical protein